MKNKNNFTLLLSLLITPLLIVSFLFAGKSVSAEGPSEHYLIAINTDVAAKKLRSVYRNPELAANRLAQAEVEASLDADSRVTARSFSHVPVVTAQLSSSDVIELEKNELVEAVIPEEIFRPTLASSSAVIDTAEAYGLGFDGTGVAVAILDTGVDNDHAFVNVVSEACYSNAGGFGGATSLCPGGVPSSTAPDSADTDRCTAASGCDHGTHVAGIAAGDGDGAAYTGVAKDSEIIAINVFTQFNSGCFPEAAPCLGAYTSDIVAGLNRVLALHNDISFTTPIASANMSIGGGLYSSQSSCDSANATTKTAIDNLRTAGIATIISSGNDYSSDSISSPGCISSAIAVGATTDADDIAAYSNSNNMVDLVAPGSSITSSVIGSGNFGTKSGTSMSSPQVSGAWAILKEKTPEATVDEIYQAFEETGAKITDSRNGLHFKRIDIDDALVHKNFESIFVKVVDDETTEAGGTARVQFSLRQAPLNNVTIPLSIDDPTEGDLGVVTDIVITPASWNNPALNEVVITGLDDAERDGIVSYKLVTGDPSSTDVFYDGIDADGVADPKLKNLDDEKAVKHDFDGDGASDIFSASSGKWRVSFKGKSSWKTLNTSSTKLSQMLFGDFNCDQKTDIFTVKNNKWLVSYGGKSAWKKINTSSAPFNQMLIADIDGDACSDVVRLTGQNWYVSYKGKSAWSKLQKSSTLKSKVKIGDLNGDGRDDAFYATGSRWKVSYSMKTSWKTLNVSVLDNDRLILGDITGDQSMDIFWPTGKKWYTSDKAKGSWKNLSVSGYKNLKLTDLNGDGKEDVFRVKSGKWFVSYSGTSTWKKINTSSVRLSQMSID
ncbi:MAG: S8 family serine peptidase [Candidatus Saccharimonadales bacterium]|nr:S8 family serine peptidase [Candidatus Saccharimonadales bacterium]